MAKYQKHADRLSSLRDQVDQVIEELEGLEDEELEAVLSDLGEVSTYLHSCERGLESIGED